MRRALVILGDEELGRALISGSVPVEQQLIPVKTSFFHEDVRKSVRYATGCRDWKTLYYNLIATRGFPEDYHKPNFVSRNLSIAWALMWYTIFEWYERLSAWNRQS